MLLNGGGKVNIHAICAWWQYYGGDLNSVTVECAGIPVYRIPVLRSITKKKALVPEVTAPGI
jgi:hypothetical protein